jgi:flagellin-like hook-associated protein FlgL
MEAAEVGINELLSKAEDADMPEVVSQLNQQQFTYQTALAVNAQVLRTSLLDFLK